MRSDLYEAALWSAGARPHEANSVWRRDEAEALSTRARAALRGLWSYRTLNRIRTLGPMDFRLMRAVRRGDDDEVVARVRECIEANEEAAKARAEMKTKEKKR